MGTKNTRSGPAPRPGRTATSDGPLPATHLTEVRDAGLNDEGHRKGWGLFARVLFRKGDVVAILELAEASQWVRKADREADRVYFKVAKDLYAPYLDTEGLLDKMAVTRGRVGSGGIVNSTDTAQGSNVKFAKSYGTTVAVVATRSIKVGEEVLAYYMRRGGEFVMEGTIEEPLGHTHHEMDAGM